MATNSKQNNTNGRMRLDKWLKVARLFKSRSKAVDACQARHVKVNGKTAKPSHMIRIGDTLAIQYPNRNRTFDIVSLSHRPLPAAEARELYVEHLPKVSEESSELYELFMKMERKRKHERRGKGRPTKKERRELNKLKGK